MDSSRSTVTQPIYTDTRTKSLASDMEPSRPVPFQPFRRRNTVKIGFIEIPLFWANLIFAFTAVAGGVGQTVSLPLWIDSTKVNGPGGSLDSYFLLSIISVTVVIIFGLGTLFLRIFSPQDIGETERRFPHSLLFLIGFCISINGSLVVYACRSSRTPPYLQAILGNLMIPTTILFR